MGELVSFSPPVDFKQSQLLMRQSDALLLIELADKHVLTGKLFEYMSAQKPILAVIFDDSDAGRLIREGNAGLIVGTDDPKRIANGLVRLYKEWREGRSSFRADGAWLKQFNRREATAKLAQVFDDILAGRFGQERLASTNLLVAGNPP